MFTLKEKIKYIGLHSRTLSCILHQLLFFKKIFAKFLMQNNKHVNIFYYHVSLEKYITVGHIQREN